MLKPIEKHEGIVYPLHRANIDTDQIIPKQFLKRISRSGFGQFLFYNWRFDDNGKKRTDFSLHDIMYKDASILLAGENFGCGSSREHAPWSILDYGFQVVIAESFADIFYNNALKNGLIPIQLEQEKLINWMKEAEKNKLTLTVDLHDQTVVDNKGVKVHFDIPLYHQEKLINGWDDIALTLQHQEKITAYEKGQKQ